MATIAIENLYSICDPNEIFHVISTRRYGIFTITTEIKALSHPY